MSNFQIIILGIVIVAIICAAYNEYRKHKKKINEEITSKEELIAYLLKEAQSKVIPAIMKLLSNKDLMGATTYEEFKETCKDLFSEDLHNLVMMEKDELDIPEDLKQFATTEAIGEVLDSIFLYKSVDDALYKTYIAIINNNISEIIKNEEEAKEIADKHDSIKGEPDEYLHKAKDEENPDDQVPLENEDEFTEVISTEQVEKIIE